MLRKHIAVDLGTANTLVFVQSQGIVINEPSVVAVDTINERVIAVGKEAKDYIGKTPQRISTIRPLRDGVIADFDAAQALIATFLKKVIGSWPIKPDVVICVPTNITDVERRAVAEAATKAGARNVIKDYIMYRLTGVFATDLNCFGGSAMIDMETMEYSKELMQLYGIEEMYDVLPKLAGEPTEVVGYVTETAACLTGLAQGTPVVAGMMDILACLVGSGATGKDVYTAIAGSWCINETHSDRIIPNASSNMPYLYKGQYLNCSYTGASGSNYEWFTRVLGGNAKIEAADKHISFYMVLDELIGMVPVKKAKVFFSPFVAQPSIHPNAKANFIGIDQNTSYAELCYSVAEGVAFIHKYHVDFLKNAGLPLQSIRLTGGIAKSKVWNQIFANVLQIPIIGVDCEETGALGSAIAAGIGAGIYGSYEEAFGKAVKVKEAVFPDESMYSIYKERYREWEKINELMLSYWDWKNEH